MSHHASPATHWEGQAIAYWRERWNIPALHVFERLDSTNDTARLLAADGAEAGAVVLAEVQSAGRGRFGRRWDAPAGAALLLSCVSRPRPILDAAPGTLPLRVGLAAASAIEAVAPVRVELKWPNDLLIRNRKVGGILCEAASAGDALVVIVGIGINVHQQPDDWPPELRRAASSLDAASDDVIDRARLAAELIQRLRPLFAAPLQPLTAAEIAAFAQRDALAGRAVTVFTGERTTGGGTAVLNGMASGIAPEGALLLRTPSGIQRLTTGTVRPSDDPNERTAGAMP